MVLRSFSTRRLLRPVAALTIVGAGILGFAGSAHAASEVNPLDPGACIGGTVNRPVTVEYFTTASFTTAFRIHVVSGTPGGSIIQTVERTITGPTNTTVTFNLPAGTYYFDWEDADGGGVWSGRHSGLGSFYNDVYQGNGTTTFGTRTIVAECVVETTTTAAPTTTTTVATTTTAPATSTTVAVGVPTTQTAATTSTSTTVVVNVPTTAVVQTTAAASANTLPATGANSTPLIAAGVAFLGLGTVAVLSTRRRPAAQV